MGHGQRLSAMSMMVAVGVDRVRTTASNGAAAMRRHPILLLPSLVVMAGTFFALVSLLAATLHLPSGKAGDGHTTREPDVVPLLRLGTESKAGHRTSPDGVLARNAAARVHPRRPYLPRHGYGRRETNPAVAGSAADGSCVEYAVFGICENS